MSDSIRQYRIFIGSPSGLEDEREAVKHELGAYSRDDGHARGIAFHPVVWEDLAGGTRRPQDIINDALITCDFTLILLGDRMGSPPGGPGNTYESGTEEEFDLALALARNADKPMREVVVCFRSVDPRQLADPGDQLKRVLAFKQRLEQSKAVFFERFTTVEELCRILRRHIYKWTRDHEGGQRAIPGVGPEGPESPGPTTAEEVDMAKAAATGDLEALKKFLDVLMREGRLDDAAALGHRAIAVARQKGNREASAYFTNTVGIVLRQLGDYDGAEALLLQSKSLREAIYGRTHALYATVLNNLGALYEAEGRPAEAKACFDEWRVLAPEVYREEPQKLAGGLSNLASLLAHMDQYEDALRMIKDSISVFEAHPGLDDAGLARAYSNAGQILEERARFAEAEEYIGRALRLGRKVFGEEHQEMAIFYSHAAKWLARMGAVSQANEMAEKAVTIGRKVFTPWNPELAALLANAAGVHQQNGAFGRARELLSEAIEYGSASYGPGRSEYVSLVNNLGTVAYQEGRYSEALEISEKVLEWREANLGRDYPETVTTLGGVGECLAALGRLDEARTKFEDALSRLEAGAEVDRYRASIVRANAGRFFAKAGDLARGKALLGLAVDGFAETLGADHPETLRTRGTLAALS